MSPDVIRFEVPLRTGRGQNDRLHWRARAQRVKAERNAIAISFPWWAREGLCLPLWVRLTRLSPSVRPMDDDGVVGALKAVRDQVAMELGVDDGQRHLVRFSYAQERGPWGVVVEIRRVARRRQKGVTSSK